MITCFGEILVDMLQRADGTSVRHVGGAPFNVAVSAARNGADVCFVGRVGHDDNGRCLLDAVPAYGVHTRIGLDSAHATTVALVTLDAAGERSFRFLREDAADYMLSASDIRIEPSTTIVHLGTLMLNKPQGRAFADEVLREARTCGALLSVDANFRSDLFVTEALRNEVMGPYLMAADILKLGADELASLTGVSGIDEGVRALGYKGMLFVTDGASDSRVYWQGHVASARPPHLDRVVDTTGAGDAFYGAVLAGLDDIYRRQCQPTMDGLRHILEMANRCGAAATQTEGAL